MRALSPMLLRLLVLTAISSISHAGGGGAGPLMQPRVATAVLPVSAADTSWRSPQAPVTLMMFSDLQCTHCVPGMSTVDELKVRYGASKLRIVYKHFPLASHKKALPAAEAAVVVKTLRGDNALWRFISDVHADRGNHRQALQNSGVSQAALRRLLATGAPAKEGARRHRPWKTQHISILCQWSLLERRTLG